MKCGCRIDQKAPGFRDLECGDEHREDLLVILSLDDFF